MLPPPVDLLAEDRHPDTVHLSRLLVANPHLPGGHPRFVAVLVQIIAEQIVARAADGPELTAGLRKLLEAKDCFVRAVLPRP